MISSQWSNLKHKLTKKRLWNNMLILFFKIFKNQ